MWQHLIDSQSSSYLEPKPDFCSSEEGNTFAEAAVLHHKAFPEGVVQKKKIKMFFGYEKSTTEMLSFTSFHAKTC